MFFGCIVTTLNDAFECELAQKGERYESGSESMVIPTPLCKAPWLYHVSTQESLSFRPATPRACPSPGSLNTLHCHLTFEEDRDTPYHSMEHHLPDENTLACHLTSMEEEDEDEEDAEEHFPTSSLDDDVWMIEPVSERYLYIHENSQHDLCPYPCLYSLNLLHLNQNDALHGPQQTFSNPLMP